MRIAGNALPAGGARRARLAGLPEPKSTQPDLRPGAVGSGSGAGAPARSPGTALKRADPRGETPRSDGLLRGPAGPSDPPGAESARSVSSAARANPKRPLCLETQRLRGGSARSAHEPHDPYERFGRRRSVRPIPAPKRRASPRLASCGAGPSQERSAAVRRAAARGGAAARSTPPSRCESAPGPARGLSRKGGPGVECCSGPAIQSDPTVPRCRCATTSNSSAPTAAKAAI